MRKGSMGRDEAIKEVGRKIVDRLDSENCDFTNRLQTDGDDAVEFAASLPAVDRDGNDCTLIAYYYQNPEDIDCEDLGSLDWEIEGYEIV